jgi:hypothetical protein
MNEVFYTYCLFEKAQKMPYEIEQIGHINGDKWMNGVIPNMKVGELRYYPQNNPNLYRTQSRELSPKTVTRIFKSMFPGYEVELNESDPSTAKNGDIRTPMTF